MVVLQLLCACSIILCFCLLLFSHCFCRCSLVLFHPAMCLFYLCLSSVEEGTDSWACLVFFCLFFFFFLSPSRIFYYCLYLISSRVSCYVCHFLWFGFSFLHAVPAADIFYCSLFFFIMFLHISFHFYPFIQKDLGIYGSLSIKRFLHPICHNLPKSFYRRFVFYSKYVFYCRFVFCYRSLSLTFLS